MNVIFGLARYVGFGPRSLPWEQTSSLADTL